MDGYLIDEMCGKEYNLQTFENFLVKVESAGDCIRVGIKDKNGKIFSWLEPRYPFQIRTKEMPKQDEWELTVETQSHESTSAIFTRGTDRHVLTLTVTDPTATPKPVTVTWE